MNTDNRRAQRQRELAQVRAIANEAREAHALSDDESELAMLDLQLDAEHQRLDDLMQRDPLQAVYEWGRND